MLPPDQETFVPEQPMLAPDERILRRFAGDPGKYDFNAKCPRYTCLIPDEEFDQQGISMYREFTMDHPDFLTARMLLDKALGDATRERGGVMAFVVETIREHGFQVEADLGDHPGHVNLPDFKRSSYEENRRAFQNMADKFLRLMHEMVIEPKPKPSKI